MRVLGIDPSLTACGWALLDSECSHGTKLVKLGVIKSKLRGWERVDEILRALTDEILNSHQENYIIAIEGYSFGAVGNAVFQLAELGGILRYDIWKRGIPVEEWAAMTWRKAIFGKGNTRKADGKIAFKEMYGLEGDLNTLEAWAIGRTSLLFRCEADWTKAQTEVFKKRKAEQDG